MDALSAWLAVVIVSLFLANQPKLVLAPLPPPVVTAPLPPPAPKELAILLPDAEGKSSGIVVTAMGQETTVTEPYQGVELTDGKVATRQYTAAEVGQLFPDVMQALPNKPLSYTLRFEKNGTTLTAASLVVIEEIVQEIAKRAVPEITVVGHTDRVGSDETNLRLSLNRANGVRNILVAHGVAEEIIQTIGRGELELEVETADNEAEPRNRRVEISVR